MNIKTLEMERDLVHLTINRPAGICKIIFSKKPFLFEKGKSLNFPLLEH